MVDSRLEALADLLQTRNSIDEQISRIIARPMTAGHLGEWIAARIFDIELEASASAAAIDGRFRSGPLAGSTVNVKWYLRREGLLDMTPSAALDHYLVLTGPPAPVQLDKHAPRPWVITNAYLFDAHQLRADLTTRGRKVGTASSVRKEAWTAAEIFPQGRHSILKLTGNQRAALRLFAPTVPPSRLRFVTDELDR